MASMMKSTLLCSTLALAAALPSSAPASLQSRDCGTVVNPAGFWRIDQEDPNNSLNLFPFAPNASALFSVSQGTDQSLQHDLIVSFNNVPCPPAGQGPYSIEFLYEYSTFAQYTFSGNTKIDVFAVNGALPTRDFGGGNMVYPTWNNIQPLTGSLIGTFQLPANGDDIYSSKLIFINSVVCQPTINLRFSITNDNSAAGSVQYYQDSDEAYNHPGLRIRYGC